ncbi:MAG: hypothetical protein IM526_02600 [Microcystis sp. M38BS1]|uniref:hypothetical protein n=1 Tax=Microcystis sp. M38BS1 TaxID=2771188 RepID=UPI0031FE3BAB|nr:hypothetical protein [Microcystis sp. M38BS1]MCA6582550.1 hypothetical protein [Pseudanabaena sp. M34BS1SP1A06MG]
MPNILRDYQDIIETYLIGLRTQLGTNFRFYINLEEGSVTFKRDIPAAPKDSTLALKYIFDKETLEHEHPTAELLKVGVLWTLNNVLTQSMLKFSDQFYQDRADGVPFTSDEVVDMTDKNGKPTTMRLDAIDWTEFFKA